MNRIAREAWSWIEQVCEFRTLDGKRALGLSLSLSEAARLDMLRRMFDLGESGGAGLSYLDRQVERLRLDLAADLIIHGNLVPARMQDVSLTGMFVETATPLTEGLRAVVHLRAAELGRTIQFPSIVTRVDADGVALRFVGLPVALSSRRPVNPSTPEPETSSAPSEGSDSLKHHAA